MSTVMKKVNGLTVLTIHVKLCLQAYCLAIEGSSLSRTDCNHQLGSHTMLDFAATDAGEI